jgi:outer membrane lipoprotein-sorting protein
MIIDYLEYSEIQGVKYPRKMKQAMGPQTFDVDINSLEVNTGLSDDLFK